MCRDCIGHGLRRFLLSSEVSKQSLDKLREIAQSIMEMLLLRAALFVVESIHSTSVISGECPFFMRERGKGLC
jgi:hypothetical protein